DGYYVFTKDGFRFIPQQVLFLLPNERPVRIQLGMNVMRSKVINYVKWSYPPDAIKQNAKGKVVLHIVLDMNGKIKELTEVEGPVILSHAVAEAVRQWVFEPTLLDGEPVEVEINFETTFQMN